MDETSGKGAKGRGGRARAAGDRGGGDGRHEGPIGEKPDGARKGRDRGEKGGGKRREWADEKDVETEGNTNRGGKRGGKDRGGKDAKDRGGKGGRSGKGGRKGEDREGEDGEPEKDENRQGRERGAKGNRGGKGGGGKQKWNDAPMLLGAAISPALQGKPAAKGVAKQCLLCMSEAPSYVSIWPCNHGDDACCCWVCALRLRALSQDKRCPMCKNEAKEIFITDDAKASFPSRLDRLSRDSEFGVIFANTTVENDVMRLFEYRCRFQNCAHSDVAFRTLQKLEEHLWYTHYRQFCGTCLHGRSSFVCEQVVYDSRDMRRHCQHGDRGNRIGGRDVPAVPAHSWCEFCNSWHYDEDVLSYHMHSRHHLCGICEKMGYRNQFYKNFSCLAVHYAEAHYVCPHRDCCHGGHRLTVFESEIELEMHTNREHRTESMKSDKQKKESNFMMTGFRSYADEQRDRQTAGKGNSRGNQTSEEVAVFRFCWPKDMAWAAAGDQEEEEAAENGDEYNRYPDRDVLSDHGNDAPGGEERHREDVEDDNGSEEEDDDDEDDDPNVLDKRLKALSLDVTVASAGRQAGMRCCLDALEAVLQALFPGVPSIPEDALQALRDAVGCLNSVEVETLEKLRKDLARIASQSLDWGPLERVLALRPLFFRLLRSVKGGNQNRAIGPQSIGPRNSGRPAEDSSEEAWATWKLAAQSTVGSCGKMEQQYLRAYVHLCVQRRASMRLDSEGPPLGGIRDTKPEPASPQRAPARPIIDDALFPTLGPGGNTTQPVAAPIWGRRQKQVVPSIEPAPAVREEAATGWDDDEEEDFTKVEEQFPDLLGGPGSRLRQNATNPQWGSSPSRQSHVTSSAPVPSKAASKSAAKAKASVTGGVADFPTLGGAAPSGNSQAQADGWGAQARDRAKAKAEPPKPKPEPPKNFQGIEEMAFPGLPTGGAKVKPLTSAAKAGAKAGQAAKAKAAAKVAVKAQAEVAVEQVSDGWDHAASAIALSAQAGAEEQIEIVPDSQLVLIHDPLDAVAKSEAAEAERKLKKVTKKTGKRGAVANPWIAGSPTAGRG